MELYFLRHGQAQAHSFQYEDASRELTTEGRQKLQQAMPYLLEYISNKQVKVASSPLIRAIQTAQYLKQPIDIQDFLMTGNLEECLLYIKENSHVEVLILVGHEPILSNWIKTLTQQDYSVKKGMLVKVDIVHKKVNTYKLKEYPQLLD